MTDDYIQDAVTKVIVASPGELYTRFCDEPERSGFMMKKSTGFALISAALGIILAVGVLTVFSACGLKDDGTWMRCHTVQNLVAAGGGALALLFAAAAFVKSKRARIMFHLLGVLCAVVIFLLPGPLLPLCMVKTMRCYTVMQPFVRIMSVAVMICGLMGFWRVRRGETRQ